MIALQIILQLSICICILVPLKGYDFFFNHYIFSEENSYKDTFLREMWLPGRGHLDGEATASIWPPVQNSQDVATKMWPPGSGHQDVAAGIWPSENGRYRM